MGALISLNSATQPMRREAASAGFYDSPWKSKHPKIQLFTVEELLTGTRPDFPATHDLRTFKAAPKVKRKPSHKQKNFDDHVD
jgi:hypothetical protein